MVFHNETIGYGFGQGKCMLWMRDTVTRMASAMYQARPVVLCSLLSLFPSAGALAKDEEGRPVPEEFRRWLAAPFGGRQAPFSNDLVLFVVYVKYTACYATPPVNSRLRERMARFMWLAS